MRSTATERGELLRIAATTLAELQSVGFEPRLADPVDGAADDGTRAQRDTVVNALAAALDYARLEGELLAMSPDAVADIAHNEPYLPSSQALALVQTAIEEFLDEQPGSGLDELGAFDPSDPGWISTAWERLKTLFRGKHAFTAHTSSSSFQIPLPETAVVALFSDWGTGEDTARRVMRQIAAANPTHAIHLGDVYYSGTKKEIQKRFLDIIDEEGPRPTDCRFFALNSNHEMYSGGDSYFDLTLPRFNQEASYFNLKNPHWQLIGLDSGYEDHGLQDPQQEWLAAQLQANGARNILLMHHQLFSPFESRAFDRELHDKLEPFLPRVFACVWGHEHKSIIFGKHLGIHARCIGHGAIPVTVPFGDPRFPHIPIERIDDRAGPGTNQGIHGFALFRFNGPSLHASYIDEFGTKFFEEKFE
jgi:hypothetical protein